MLRAARKIGRLLSRLDRNMGQLKLELEAGIRDAGMDEGSALDIGHLVAESRENIASRLHDFFNARLDTWARQAWREYWPAPSCPPRPAHEQQQQLETSEVD